MAKPKNHKRSLVVVDLSITGRTCKIHRNDRVARSLDAGAHLMKLEWGAPSHGCRGKAGDPPDSMPPLAPLLVDRYDARTLLDETSLPPAAGTRCHGLASAEFASPPLGEEGTAEEVAARNVARYGVLAEHAPRAARSQAAEGEEHLDLEKSAAVQTNPTAPDDKDAPFEASEEILRGLPPAIALPKTVRLGAIIEQTAARIASNNQFEVFLKVKQAGNPSFSFLNDASDDLHPYFLYLKETYSNDTCGPDPDAQTKHNGESAHASLNEEASANPLSGLLGNYASSSDESAHPTQNVDVDNSIIPQGKREEEQAGDEEKGEQHDREQALCDQKRKHRADRLKRWKESLSKKNENPQKSESKSLE